MLDADTLTYEGLMALIGRRVRIESGRYPFEPAIGTLEFLEAFRIVVDVFVEEAGLKGE